MPPRAPARHADTTGLFVLFDRSPTSLAALRQIAGHGDNAARLVRAWITGPDALLMLVQVGSVKMVWPAADLPALAAGLRRLAGLLRDRPGAAQAMQFDSFAEDYGLLGRCMDLWLATQAPVRALHQTAPAAPQRVH